MLVFSASILPVLHPYRHPPNFDGRSVDFRRHMPRLEHVSSTHLIWMQEDMANEEIESQTFSTLSGNRTADVPKSQVKY
jgi:hypothetical protein